MSPLRAQLDPSGSWETWRSEHFRVHIRTEQAHLAQRVIDEAERAFRLLSAELVPPRGTVDIAVMDNVDFSNAAASVFPSNRLFVFLAQPATDAALAYYDDWLRVVMVHELTHLFHIDRVRGVWGGMQRFFGRAPWTFPNAYRSSWVKEGLATYYESKFTTAGRVRGAFHSQLLNSAEAGDRWPSSEDATLVSPQWPGGQRPYAWGSRFFALQASAFGDSVIPNFIEHSAAKLWPLTVASPLGQAGGSTVKDGWARLKNATPPLTTASEARVLVRGLRSPPDPTLSPDRSELVYVREDGKRDVAVVVMSLDGEALRRHRANAGVRLAWGKRGIVVAQYQYRTAVTIRSRLHEWVDSVWRLLPNTERLTEPFVLPSGDIAAIALGEGRRTPVVVTPDGAHEPMAVPVAGDWTSIATHDDWFAGIAVTEGRSGLYVWHDRDHQLARHVALGDALVSDPAWTPDGSAVLFVSEMTGLPQVYRYDRTDGAIRRITNEPLGARAPQMLDDGSLVFSTHDHDGFTISLATPDQLTRLRTVEIPSTPMPEVRSVSATSGGYNPWPTLTPRYWNPVIHVENRTGTFWGAFTSANDAIGRNAYFASAAVAPSNGRFEGILAVSHQRWKGATLDATLVQRWTGLNARTVDGSIIPVGERERIASVGTTVRRRWWRSGYAFRVAAGYEQNAFFDETADGVLVFDSPSFVTATVSGRLFHRSRPAFAISTENGIQVDGLYQYRRSVSSDEWSTEVFGNLSVYVGMGLPGFANWVVAARTSIGVTGGTVPASLSIGGESGDIFELAPGIAIGSGRRAFSMRGYPRVGGFDAALVAVAELRIPIALVAKGTWIVPIVLDRISTTVFYEVGAGRYLRDVVRENSLQSAGAELVLHLGVLYDVPTRLRVGWAVPLRDGLGVSRGDSRIYLTFGVSF